MGMFIVYSLSIKKIHWIIKRTEIQVKPTFAVNTLCLPDSISSSRQTFTQCLKELKLGQFQIPWRTNHRSSGDVGFFKSFCFFIQFHIHFLWVKIVTSCLWLCVWGHCLAAGYIWLSSMHVPDGITWWITICMYFSALRTPLFLTQSIISCAEMQPQTCQELLPCLTFAYRPSLLCVSAALWWTNGLLLQPNISDFYSSVQSTSCHFSLLTFSMSEIQISGCMSCPWRPLLNRHPQSIGVPGSHLSLLDLSWWNCWTSPNFEGK